MKEYKRRIADKLLIDALEAKGAVLIEGPKWCGKTTTAEQFAKSVIYMQDPSKKDQYIQMASISPNYLLQGEVPHLIDEWQLAPSLWDSIRYEVDRRDEFGQFILTGSAVPPKKDETSHTGTGRISRIKMSPMTLYESGDSNGSVSLQELFNGNREISGINESTIETLAFLVCRGGWPKAIGQKESVALRQAIDYYDGLTSSDISRVDGVSRSEERVKRLLRSYARNICTQIKNVELKKDIMVNDSSSLNEDTVVSYIDALKKLYVVADIPAWNPNLRSKAAVRTSDTRQFIDSSIATAALGIGPQDLINDLNTFGFMFESMCDRDLRVYAQYLDGNLYHYRDSNNLECDAVIHLRNGNWAAFEVKLGIDKIDEGAKHLLKLAELIDEEKMKKPSFLMVISGTVPFAYRRPDGVYVCPITCLKY